MKISAALIVKNEERFLLDCLESIRAHVDEIVIVDTGSTDATVDIAIAGGAKVYHFPWTGDFAAARNFGLDHCSGDWILYIDADERLDVDPPRRLAELINPLWIGATVRFRPKTGYTRYAEPRLFRLDPRLRFRGRIHETLYGQLLEISRSEGLEIGASRAKINHLGYDGEQGHKHSRNLPLLEEAVRASPDRVYLWYHLAVTLQGMGRVDDAVVAANTGLAAARRNPSRRSRADAGAIFQLLADHQFDRGHDPRPILDEGLTFEPENHALRFLQARREIVFGDAEIALRIIEELLSVDPDDSDHAFLAFDSNIFGRLALDLKVRALMKQGRLREASLQAASMVRAARP